MKTALFHASSISTLAELEAFCKELRECLPANTPADTVYVTGMRGWLMEEILTDGSTVYNVHLGIKE